MTCEYEALLAPIGNEGRIGQGFLYRVSRGVV